MTITRTMTTPTARRRALGWILGGGAFLTGVMATPGCAVLNRTRPPAPSAGPPATVQIVQSDADRAPAAVMEMPPAATTQPDAAAGAGDAMSYGAQPPANGGGPPVVNVFGEFDGQRRDSTMSLAEAGFQRHTFLDEGYDADVAVDPSGQWLVFASTRHRRATDLYLQRTDGVSVVQLTSDAAEDANPVFSPDGRSIAFASTRAGSWDIYMMDTDGRNVMQVTSGPSQDLHPSFSPDGTRLVYCSVGGESAQWELWVIDLRSGERRMIGFGLFPSWSPRTDADRIAFQRARERGSRWFSLWTLDLVDGEARRVTEVAASADAALVCPAWSPDGKRIAFSTITEPARTVNGTADEGRHPQRPTQDVWAVNDDGTRRQRLTDGSALCTSPWWAPDGRVYFVSDRGNDGADAIWSVRAQDLPSAIAGQSGAPSHDAEDDATDVFGSADTDVLGH